jgi:hypothetical protein
MKLHNAYGYGVCLPVDFGLHYGAEKIWHDGHFRFSGEV